MKKRGSDGPQNPPGGENVNQISFLLVGPQDGFRLSPFTNIAVAYPRFSSRLGGTDHLRLFGAERIGVTWKFLFSPFSTLKASGKFSSNQKKPSARKLRYDLTIFLHASNSRDRDSFDGTLPSSKNGLIPVLIPQI